MSEQQFNILFRGDIVLGFQLGDVKLRLQQLFKTDEAKINALFTGRPVVLKRNLDIAAAEKYRKALLQAGAQVELVADTHSPTSAAPAVTQSIKSPSAVSLPQRSAVATTALQGDLPQSTAPSVGSMNRTDGTSQAGGTLQDWGLSPVGANLLKPAERHTFVAREIDTSGLQIRAPGGNLLDAHELSQRESGPQHVPDFGLAKAGENLIAEHEKVAAVNPEVGIVDWQIADLGSDLISEGEREIVLPALINNLDVSLAPLGADLGQIKSPLKPLQPDISKIQLAE